MLTAYVSTVTSTSVPTLRSRKCDREVVGLYITETDVDESRHLPFVKQTIE